MNGTGGVVMSGGVSRGVVFFLGVALAACGAGDTVPIVRAPDSGANGGAAGSADAGLPESDAELAVLTEPPGLVEGEVATAARASAEGAVIRFAETTEVVTFIPIQNGSPGTPLPVTPTSLAGWGSGPAALSISGVSDADASVVVFRGPSSLSDFGQGRRLVEIVSDQVGTPVLDSAAQALQSGAPLNGLYRLRLSGADAEHPVPLASALVSVTGVVLAEAARKIFLATHEGIAVVPMDGSGSLSLVIPRAGDRLTIIGVMQETGLLVYVKEVVDSDGRAVEANLLTVLAEAPESPPSSHLIVRRLEVNGQLSYRPLFVEVLPGGHLLCTAADGQVTVVDPTGAHEPIALNSDGSQVVFQRMVGNRLLHTVRVVMEGNLVSLKMHAVDLSADGYGRRQTVDLPPEVGLPGYGVSGAVDANGERLALIPGFGVLAVVIVNVVDGTVEMYPAPELLQSGRPGLAFTPDGRSLVMSGGSLENGQTVVRLPLSGDPTEVLVAPERSIRQVSLGRVTGHGEIVLIRDREERTGVSLVHLDGEVPSEVTVGPEAEVRADLEGGLLLGSAVGKVRTLRQGQRSAETLLDHRAGGRARGRRARVRARGLP